MTSALGDGSGVPKRKTKGFLYVTRGEEGFKNVKILGLSYMQPISGN